MFQKLKQYKDLRDTAKKAQSMLEQITVHGDAKGGKVAVVMDGNQNILNLDIDESLLSPEHKQEIEEGVKEAIKNAMRKLQREMMMKMKSGDLEMPDMSKLT
jgi:nucleoid-associated protein EbfC